MCKPTYEELEQKIRELEKERIDRKQAEEALKKSEERFRVLVEESPLGVFLIDKDGHYRYINPKFIEMFGRTTKEIGIHAKYQENI